MQHNLALIGFGNVARALVRLLLRKQSLLEGRYGVDVFVHRHCHRAAWICRGSGRALTFEEGARAGGGREIHLPALSSRPGAGLAGRHPGIRSRRDVRELAGESQHGPARAGPCPPGAEKRDACHHRQQGDRGPRLSRADVPGGSPGQEIPVRIDRTGRLAGLLRLSGVHAGRGTALFPRRAEFHDQHHPHAAWNGARPSIRRCVTANRSAWQRPTPLPTWTAGTRPSRSRRWSPC